MGAMGTGVGSIVPWCSGSEHLPGVRQPGLATDGLCAIELVTQFRLSCVVYPKIALTSKLGTLMPGAVYRSHLYEVEEGCRCRERSSSLDKVGCRGSKEEVTFDLYPER